MAGYGGMGYGGMGYGGMGYGGWATARGLWRVWLHAGRHRDVRRRVLEPDVRSRPHPAGNAELHVETRVLGRVPRTSTRYYSRLPGVLSTGQ